MAEKKKKKKRPGGINPMALIEPIKAKLATLKKGDKAIPALEDFIFNKTQLGEVGEEMREGHFTRLGAVSEHDEDARSVFLVKHIFSELVLVQKVIHQDKDVKVLEMIHNEISIMHDCVSPDIVQFYGSFLSEAKDGVNIVMEYMDGHCVETMLSRIGRIEETMLGAMTSHILNGLFYLQSERRVIHRDMKPANVLLSTKGEVKICDFGVSRTMDTMKTKKMTYVGTNRYMSPERLLGNPYSAASDVWAIGFMLIEMATGNYPLPVDGTDVLPPMIPVRDPRSPGYTGFDERIFNVPMMTLVHQITNGPLPKVPDGVGFSGEFAEFVASTTKRESKARMPIQDAMRHPWIARCEAAAPDLGEYVRLSLPEDPKNHGPAFLDDDSDSELDEEVDFSTSNRIKTDDF